MSEGKSGEIYYASAIDNKNVFIVFPSQSLLFVISCTNPGELAASLNAGESILSFKCPVPQEFETLRACLDKANVTLRLSKQHWSHECNDIEIIHFSDLVPKDLIIMTATPTCGALAQAQTRFSGTCATECGICSPG